MPSSHPSNIAEIITIAAGLQPASILDIGVGTGKYGMLFRDYVDGHWAGNAFHDPATWKMKMVGIEIFPAYITPVHKYLYDDIWIGDAAEILHTQTPQFCFDLVFLGDVIEHFTKEKGTQLIQDIRDKWLSKTGKILLSTPNFATQIDNPHLAIFGNANEIHRSRWHAEDFAKFNMPAKAMQGKLLTVLLG